MARKVPKRIRSLYVLYQRLFGYTSTATPEQRKNYARAIAETNRAIEATWKTRDMRPVVQHRNSKKVHPLAVKFLDHFEYFVRQYSEALTHWPLVVGEIRLDSSLFPNAQYDGISIPFSYAYDVGTHEVVLLTYGPPREMSQEVGALLVLVTVGRVRPPLDLDLVRGVRYWDLSRGEEYAISITEVPQIDQQQVLEACASLLEE